MSDQAGGLPTSLPTLAPWSREEDVQQSRSSQVLTFTVTPGQGCIMKEHAGIHPKPLAQHHRDNGNNNNHP